MFQRHHLQALTARMLQPRKFIQVLVGPRQVGKTTLVVQLIEKLGVETHFISADAVAAVGTAWLEQQWEVARTKMDQSGQAEYLLVIDEIQKIDNWSELVKLQWDTDTRFKRNLKVILLGSSRLHLQSGLSESLAGRFETTYIGHWSFVEMHEAFGWNANQYVWFGGYPGAADLIGDEARWKKYVKDSLVETSITKDILLLTRVDKPALMRNLFELGCLYSSQILSYTKMLGQLHDAGNTTTLAHYLRLLDTAGLLAGIEKYSGNTIQKKASTPKLLVHNTALISAQRYEFLEDILQRPEEWGRMVESAIGAHLLNSAAEQGFTLHYWREGNYEVDFVIEQKKRIGIEVKSGRTIRASGMAAFRQKFNPDKCLLIGDSALSWEEFLRLDPATLFK